MAKIDLDSDLSLKNMPYSLEAEQSVLGGLLLEPEALSSVLTKITKPDMFYRKQHKELFSCFVNMFNINATIDFITVLDETIRENVFSNHDEAKMYLAQLMEMVPTVSNILDYCDIVVEKYYVRTLINACNDITERSYEGDVKAKALLDFAEQRIYDIRQGKDATSLTRIDTVIIEAYDRLLKLSGEDKDEYLGLRSGFKRLDTLTSGLNKSDLILVAGRPGMGKTSFALNIAVNVAKKYDKEVAIFSLEMSNEQLVSRVLSSETRIQSNKLRTGRLTPDDWVYLAQGADVLSKTKIYLDDSAGITIAEMKAKLRRFKNLGLVVIDYLQLMSSGRATENRVQEISAMTRNLKIMAKELNVPVILLSQLSRASEQRSEHKPQLSDLRDSGSIEQDADIVLFLYREEYYEKKDENRNDAICVVAKNRHGETGDVDMRWLGEYTRYEDVEYREEPNG